MRKNHYYRSVLKPDHGQQLIIITILQALAQFLSLPLKVFVRRDFGERYFSLPLVVIILVALAVVPYQFGTFTEYSYGGRGLSKTIKWDEFLGHYLTWYGLLLLCLRVSLKRDREITRSRSSFDFGKYSLYSGKIWDWFYTIIKIKKQRPTIRQVEIIIEPAFFFLIGLVLLLTQQWIGAYLMFASLLECWAAWMMYRSGDNFVLDTIDEMICNQDMAETFIEGRADETERGFRFYGQIPLDPDNRQKVAEAFYDGDDPDEVAEAR